VLPRGTEKAHSRKKKDKGKLRDSKKSIKRRENSNERGDRFTPSVRDRPLWVVTRQQPGISIGESQILHDSLNPKFQKGGGAAKFGVNAKERSG